MGFAFAETMSGWLEPVRRPAGLGDDAEPDADEETRYPFHFRVTASAASTLKHLRDGKASLVGVVHAPPYCQAADATGEIEIRPFGARIIRYRLSFRDDSGAGLRFRGQKNLSYAAPLRTFTELDGELVDDAGGLVARAKLTFDLRRDWLAFARSFHRIR